MPVEPSEESMNTSMITTPLEPSDGAMNVSTVIDTADNASTLTTAQDSVNHNQDISPVTTMTVENHTRPIAINTPTRSSPTLLSRVLVDHTPKAIRDTTAKRSIPKARLLTSAESLAILQEKEDKKQRKKAKANRKRRKKETSIDVLPSKNQALCKYCK